jgi:hypothetical protein
MLHMSSKSDSRKFYRSSPSESADDAHEGAISIADLAAHVDRIERALGSEDLAGLVRRIHNLLPKVKERVALPLVAESEENNHGGICVFLESYVGFQPTHIVLSEEAARAFELVDWKIGCRSMNLAGGNLPLETFSIKHMANDQFAMVNEWTNAPKMYPGIRLTMYVQRRAHPQNGLYLGEFRGLLWGLMEKIR